MAIPEVYEQAPEDMQGHDGPRRSSGRASTSTRHLRGIRRHMPGQDHRYLYRGTRAMDRFSSMGRDSSLRACSADDHRPNWMPGRVEGCILHTTVVLGAGMARASLQVLIHVDTDAGSTSGSDESGPRGNCKAVTGHERAAEALPARRMATVMGSST